MVMRLTSMEPTQLFWQTTEALKSAVPISPQMVNMPMQSLLQEAV